MVLGGSSCVRVSRHQACVYFYTVCVLCPGQRCIFLGCCNLQTFRVGPGLPAQRADGLIAFMSFADSSWAGISGVSHGAQHSQGAFDTAGPRALRANHGVQFATGLGKAVVWGDSSWHRGTSSSELPQQSGDAERAGEESWVWVWLGAHGPAVRGEGRSCKARVRTQSRTGG